MLYWSSTKDGVRQGGSISVDVDRVDELLTYLVEGDHSYITIEDFDGTELVYWGEAICRFNWDRLPKLSPESEVAKALT